MAEGKFIVFNLDKEFYGIPIEKVERILPTQNPTRVPKAHEMFLGVFDLRGETVPAIDLRTRFDFDKRDGESNFVVVQSEIGRYALRVDGVDGIATLRDGDIDTTAEMLKQKDDDFIFGVGKHNDRLIVLVDCNNIVPVSLRSEIGVSREIAA